MGLITLGKQCIKEAMIVLDKVSAEIIQFKGVTKNVQIAADLAAEEAIISTLKKSGQDFLVISEEREEQIKIGKDPEIEVYVDPLDGSSYFLTGNTVFAVDNRVKQHWPHLLMSGLPLLTTLENLSTLFSWISRKHLIQFLIVD